MSATCSGLPVMFSAWNAKISTSVASSASMLTGAKRGSSTCSNHARPRVRTNHCRSSTPAASGMTMKTSTEYSSTWNGTCSDEAPLTRKRTIGANSTSISRSFTETCTSVYAGSPSDR